MSNTIQFTEVYNKSGSGTIRDFGLRVIYINPNHVISLREDTRSNSLLREGSLPDGLDPRQQFTSVSLNKGSAGEVITVVGPIHDVHSRLFENQKILLRG